jgi:hypothetical protein
MNWLKGFSPLRKVEVKIAKESLDWAFERGKLAQQRLYQAQQEPLRSPHCYLHEDGPVPLHRTGLDTYVCLFCRNERQSGALARVLAPMPGGSSFVAQDTGGREYPSMIRTRHNLSIPPHVQGKIEQS